MSVVAEHQVGQACAAQRHEFDHAPEHGAAQGGGAQQEKPIEEAWPELLRRREEALNRPGLSPAAKKLVREYFERLRPEGK